MQKRHDAYQNLYKAYDEALTLDAELYEMLQKEDLTEEQLQKQVESINKTYKEVTQANKEFNKYTEQYNKKKKEFYEALGIEVTYNEEESTNTSEEK
jgi:predicted transcriptional regulator